MTYKSSRQKTRIVDVPRGKLATVRRMIAKYARLRQLIEELLETNIAAFKSDAVT